MIVCEPSQKPLMLFHLMHAHNVTNALVFTKSAESTTRLVQLLGFFEAARAGGSEDGARTPVVAHAYSSDLPPGERRAVLEKFRHQEIQMCVARLDARANADGGVRAAWCARIWCRAGSTSGTSRTW